MSTLREVIFMGQDWAEAMLPDPTMAVISITGPRSPAADLNDGWHAVLRLQFDDVDPEEGPPDAFDGHLVPLTAAQAAQIVAFARAISGQVATLVVHCRYGQSRSPGVAKALCEHFGLAFPARFSAHNRHVYRLVSAALAPAPGA